MREIKQKTKNMTIIIVCSIIFLFITMLSPVLQVRGMGQFNGVLMAVQFGLCLFMSRGGNRIGTIVSTCLMVFSIVMIIHGMFIGNPIGPLPGLCNTIIYIITLLTLATQFRIREKEAVTDYLTGMMNRRGMVRMLRKNIEDNEPFHLIYVDLANFRMINDNHGHAFGNQLLKKVAERIENVVGKDENITRIGGNEFLIILEKEKNPEVVANIVLSCVREKISISHNGVMVDTYLNAYAGISSFPKDGKHYEELLKFSDIAMSSAKEDKALTAYYFDKKMEERLAREVELEKLIKEALEKDYFYLVYQPQFTIEDKKLRGFETLLRLKTPDGIVISPAEFIPIAEKRELIFEIDNYVIQRAMKEFADLVKRDSNKPILSVNISAKNIADPEFPDKVMKKLAETGFPADNLEIEITEYCLVQSIDISIQNINRLKALGVKVALDDFGTGYTSLSYLSEMPVDLLKIDKSLVDDITKGKKKQEFVHAVISMGHMMGLQVISEGVESEEQLEILKNQHCDLVQGFVWGRPLTYEDARGLMC